MTAAGAAIAIRWLGFCLLIGFAPVGACLESQFDDLDDGQQNRSVSPEGLETATDSPKSTDVPTVPRGPLEVPTRIIRDAEPKEAAFDFPAIDLFLQPFTDWKNRIAEEHDFYLGLDYQPLAQWSNNEAGEEDFATGAIFRLFGTWLTWGDQDPRREGNLEFTVENRSPYGSNIPPENLAPFFGWIGSSAPDWTDQDWGLSRFLLRQRLDIGANAIELRAGRMVPFAQFDVTTFSDNLTGFLNNSIIFNPTVAYPQSGSWGVAGYFGRRESSFYAIGMIQDANGRYDDFSFDPLGKDEYFKGLEFGWSEQDVSSGLAYLVNNLHAALWHIDSESYGAALTGSYVFAESRYGAFFRVGWANEGARSLYRHYAGGGFTRAAYRDSLFGVGFSWGETQIGREEQTVTEVFYRWQFSQNVALTPTLQFLFNPALNAEDDVVTVFGLRLRLSL